VARARPDHRQVLACALAQLAGASAGLGQLDEADCFAADAAAPPSVSTGAVGTAGDSPQMLGLAHAALRPSPGETRRRSAPCAALAQTNRG
jgi:hypothetical protein